MDKLGLSFKSAADLNAIIDKQLPSRPPFCKEEILIGAESFDLYLRNIKLCPRALFGDTELADAILLAPERHYKDESRKVRVYGDMNTGEWCYSVQVCSFRSRRLAFSLTSCSKALLEALQPGATLLPLIFSSDKTQVTVFGNKTAYPLYMTMGGILKDI